MNTPLSVIISGLRQKTMSLVRKTGEKQYFLPVDFNGGAGEQGESQIQEIN